MIVLIDALSQVGSGSRTYLYNVLPRLTAISGDLAYRVLWPSGKPLPPGSSGMERMSFRKVHLPQKPALFRVLYQQLVVPFLAQKADLFFAPVDTAPLFCPAPLVLAVRNPNPFYELERPCWARMVFFIKKIFIRLSAKRADRVIFVSEHSRRHIGPQLEIPEGRMKVIYHGIDRERFQRHLRTGGTIGRIPDAKMGSYVLSISTITPHKNFEALIRAYGSLPEDLQEKHPLRIAGRIASDRYYRDLLDLIEKEGLADRVRFLGEYPYQHIHVLYQDAAVFVLPSYVETFGHTLVEAMASGTPVIASDRSVIPEILGDAGMVFEPDDPGQLRAQLVQVLSDERLFQELSRKGRERSEDFSWDKTTRALIETFKDCGR